MRKASWTIEELQILEDINRQLDGGKLLCRGQEIQARLLNMQLLRRQRRAKNTSMCQSGLLNHKKVDLSRKDQGLSECGKH